MPGDLSILRGFFLKASIYDYKNYKTFILDWIQSCEKKGRGKRRELSDFIGCQISHITAVLSNDAEFSLEQAESASRFMGLNEKEASYFLLLVQFARAGTQNLRHLFEKQINERKEKSLNLKETLKFKDSISSQDESRYYSSWVYAAIHVMISIPTLNTREAIAKRLGLSLAITDQVLAFLSEIGLIEKKGSAFYPLKPLLHLEKTSPLIAQHHTNWRMKSTLAFHDNIKDSLHYSSVATLSKKDFSIIRQILEEGLTKSLDIIKASPEEEIAVMSLDFYKI